MLAIYRDLFTKLNASNVVFCNWKSHHQVNTILAGEGDLDLFVPMINQDNFHRIANDCGFKKVQSYQAHHEFIEHYYGLDPTTLKFAHLHVHFKIVTGEHASKNYLLPIDQYVIDNIDSSNILPTITNAGRRNIFLIRHFLKIGSLYGLLQYWKELPKYSKEWSSFDHSIDYESMDSLSLTSTKLSRLGKSYSESSIIKQFLSSMQFKFKLRNYRRRGWFAYFIFIHTNFLIRLLNKFFLKKGKLFSPGIVIAVCGLDGSGKSSLVSSLNKNLGKHFSIKRLHLGRPASSKLTFLLNPLIKSYSLVIRIFKKGSKSLQQHGIKKISIIYAIRSVLLAYDRRLQAIRAHNLSQRGYLVICDRYPGLEVGKMDSPRIITDSKRGYLYQFCWKLEQNFYNSIKPAQILFNLSVPLETAIQRNNSRQKFGKETNDELRERFLINSGADFLAEYKYVVDATQSFDSVFSEVLNKFWFSKTW